VPFHAVSLIFPNPQAIIVQVFTYFPSTAPVTALPRNGLGSLSAGEAAIVIVIVIIGAALMFFLGVRRCQYGSISLHIQGQHPHRPELPRLLRKRGVAHALVLRTDGESPSALGDDEVGGYLAVRHLVDLGHRDIAVVTGPSFTSTGIARLAGARRALGRSGHRHAGRVANRRGLRHRKRTFGR